MSFPCLTDEAKGSFGETFHLKTVVRTGVLGIYYWIEVRMESEEEHTGRQMEANIYPVRIAKTLFTGEKFFRRSWNFDPLAVKQDDR